MMFFQMSVFRVFQKCSNTKLPLHLKLDWLSNILHQAFVFDHQKLSSVPVAVHEVAVFIECSTSIYGHCNHGILFIPSGIRVISDTWLGHPKKLNEGHGKLECHLWATFYYH